MRGHASFSPTFWIKGSGRRLRGKHLAQLLGAYLITAPGSNLIGLYYLPIGTICHELDMDEDTVREALKECAKADLAHYDETMDLVWVPNAAEREIGDSMTPRDKRRPAVDRELRPFRDHRFGIAFVQRYGVAFCLTEKGHSETQEGASKGLPESRKPPVRYGTGSDLGSGSDAREEPTSTPTPIPDPPKEPTKAERLERWESDCRAEFCAGIRKATGGPYVFPSGPWQQGALNETIAAHARRKDGTQLRGTDVLQWVRSAAENWASDYGGKGLALTPKSFQTWCNSNPFPAAKRARAAPEAEWTPPYQPPAEPVRPEQMAHFTAQLAAVGSGCPRTADNPPERQSGRPDSDRPSGGGLGAGINPRKAG